MAAVVSVSICSGSTFPTKKELTESFNKIPKMIVEYRDQLLQQAGDMVDEEIQSLLDQLERIEQLLEDVADLLSPFWTKGSIRNWEKEIDDAMDDLMHYFHVYIPAKIMELISKVIPVEFVVNVLGVDIDVLRILEPGELARIKKEIVANVEEMFPLLPKLYQVYNGEYGVECPEWKAQAVWQYILAKIQNFVITSLYDLFNKLIDKFKEIWDALSLPSIPDILNFDVVGYIEGIIKDFADKTYQEIVDTLKSINLFGYSLWDFIQGDVEITVLSKEQLIDKFKRAVTDFINTYIKKILFDWIDKIAKFLRAIGLGAILDLFVLTFCDVLRLIGIPTSFEIAAPTTV